MRYEPLIGPVAVQRVGDRPARVIALVVVAVTATVLAILKPWVPPAAPRGSARPPIVAAVAASTPPASPSPAVSLPASCYLLPQWRLITEENSPLGDTRTLYGLVPIPATGPADDQIPTAELYASKLYGIGVARPLSGSCSEEGRALDVHIWLIPRFGAPVRVDDVVAVTDTSPYRRGQTYFVTPDQHDVQIAGPRLTQWSPGRYVVEIDRSGVYGGPIWVALDFATGLPA